MSEPVGALVVGAALGGLRAAEQLRAQGYDGPLTIVGDEPHPPYNRPPLSKDVLWAEAGTGRDEHLATLAFRPRSSATGLDWRLGRRAVAADLTGRTVTMDDGSVLGYDGLVVATGLRSRRLRVPGPGAGRYALRTLDDAVALRAALVPGARVVVVGAGFIGCEVAASARRLGCAVSVVEPLERPMVRALGARVGAAVQRYHEGHGVEFVLGRGVRGFAAGPDRHRVGAVVLDDGTTIPADVVVESVGSVTNVEWLGYNGLDLSDGLVCDDRLRVEGRPDVVAVGDVARYPDPYAGRVRRIEHWSVPSDTAKRAAATLAAHLRGAAVDDNPFRPLPSFWSDQYTLRIQSFGAPSDELEIHLLEGDLDDPDCLESGVAVGYRRDGALVGVVLLGVPPARYREFRDLVSGALSAA